MHERLVVLSSESETENFATEIAQSLRTHGALTGGVIIGLSGELGAGKTTFARYFIKALGCKLPVSSPTYVLQHEYESESGLLIEHWDLYRLKGKSEDLLPAELFDPPPEECVRLIEWFDISVTLSEEADVMIQFSITESGREARVKDRGLVSGHLDTD